MVDAQGSQLIVGQRVSDCASDAGQLEADLASIPQTLGSPTTALADCGYADKEVFERLGSKRPGLALYLSVHRQDAHAERRYDCRPLDQIKQPKPIVDPVLLAMADKRKTPEGKVIDRKWACTVEPVLGIIKAVRASDSSCCAGCAKSAANGIWCVWPITSNGYIDWARS